MKTPTFLWGFFLADFNYKIGEKLRCLTKMCPPVGVSPENNCHGVIVVMMSRQRVMYRDAARTCGASLLQTYVSCWLEASGVEQSATWRLVEARLHRQ